MKKGEALFNKTPGKPIDHYVIIKSIESGTLALVKHVENKYSKCPRTMKVIKKAFIDLQEDEENFMKEIVIFRSLVNKKLIINRITQTF